MFGPDYQNPANVARRAAMNNHYVPCVECGRDVCGQYATGRDTCSYLHDDCAGGETHTDGVFCAYCR